MFKKILMGLSIILLGTTAYTSELPDFGDLSLPEIEDVLQDFTANSFPTTVSGAASMGRVVGVEFGLVGGVTTTDSIEKYTLENDVDKMPTALIFARVDAPFGFGAEVTMLPLEIGDVEYNTFSIAGRMNVNKFMPLLPVNLKAKLRFGNSDISYKGNVDGNDVEGDMSNTYTSLDLTVSKKFIFVEPYAGIGFINAKGDYKYAATNPPAPVVGPISTEKKDVKMNTEHLFAGVQVNLVGFKLGLEYSKLYDSDRIMAKFAFGLGL